MELKSEGDFTVLNIDGLLIMYTRYEIVNNNILFFIYDGMPQVTIRPKCNLHSEVLAILGE